MNSNEIKKKVAYFKKVIKNMDNLDLKKEIIREDYEDLSAEIEYIAYTEDRYFEGNLIDWIELVKNIDLYGALKSLSIEEQTLISYVFYKEKTYSEIAKVYEKDRSVIGKRITKAIAKIKLFLCKK